MRYSGNRSSKYGNHKANGFDSKKEESRYAELALMQRAGIISDLRRQVKFELIPSQYKDGKCVYRSVSYIADFVYEQNGELVVEDSKGFKTPEYIIKKKLMLYIHGIIIKET